MADNFVNCKLQFGNDIIEAIVHDNVVTIVINDRESITMDVEQFKAFISLLRITN